MNISMFDSMWGGVFCLQTLSCLGGDAEQRTKA